MDTNKSLFILHFHMSTAAALHHSAQVYLPGVLQPLASLYHYFGALGPNEVKYYLNKAL